MRIIFMGSPDFAVPSFDVLAESEHEIVGVFTREAKPKNRGKKLEETIIAGKAKEKGIEVFTPKTLRDKEIQEKIMGLKADFIVVVAYGLLLPARVLGAAKFSCLNLHPSSLPKFRGAAPIQRTLMAGEKKTDICIIEMAESLDSGDILLKRELQLDNKITAGELHDKAANIGAKLMLEVINNYQSLASKAIKQNEKEASYAPKIEKSEAKIDFDQDGESILNKIRALNPFPGAFFELENIRYKIFDAEFETENHAEKIGKIDKNFNIYCKSGILKPKTIQKQGKSKMPISDFLRGESITI